MLRAISAQTMDHRGPDFAEVGRAALAGMKSIFKTDQHVFIYPSSGTGAWEAALVNVLSEGDKVLMYETGHFATLWKKMAAKLGVDAEFIEGDWRRGGPRPDRSAAACGYRTGDQGGLRCSQRNLDRLCVAHRAGASGDRRGRPSGTADG
ncbi:hypothetical protein ACFQFQ_22215 [Sulfitobacter porphyrae]|uniref:Aminotransferase class V domain-containing protein n=1 Tax=Sulfitobacter porphyrae TaxID=1246864 RepID=A0ABW2B738_9RHOB